MKITDVSSSSAIPEDIQDEKKDQVGHKTETSRKTTLLQRYNIPIEHLDFSYVNKCTDTSEIERILRILRSGEEGTYPDLERCVVTCLEKLNPNSRLLRVEIPAVRTTELDKEERESIQNGLEAWLNEVSKKSSSTTNKLTEIFTHDDHTANKNLEGEELKNLPLPIRGSVAHDIFEQSSNQATSTKNKNDTEKTRIKSWEYDKWDKYDVDTELTKLDITDMQREEWERREKPKLIEEQKRIERLMKPSEEDLDYQKSADMSLTKTKPSTFSTAEKMTASPLKVLKPNTSSVLSQQRHDRVIRNCPKKKQEPVKIPVEKASYIEEVNDEDDDDDEKGVKVNTTAIFSRNGPRKATVIIEDLNLPM